MSQDGSDRNPSNPEPTVGRTPWDFAVEALRRLGPTVVVMAFIGVGSFYFYQERNNALQEAKEEKNAALQAAKEESNDALQSAKEAELKKTQLIEKVFSAERERLREDEQDLRDSLRYAQEQIVRNSGEIQNMNGKLIANIESMMGLKEELDKEVDKERAKITRMRTELELSQSNLDKSRNELEESNKQLERSKNELKIKEQELKTKEQEIVDATKRLESQIMETDAARLIFEEKEGESKQSKEADDALLNEYADQLGELREEVTDTSGSAIENVKVVLLAFKESPDIQETGDALASLVGLQPSLIEEAVSANGLGYEVWFRSSYAIYGYLRQDEDGPRNYIKLLIQKNKKTKKERITRVYRTLANVLIKLPQADNLNLYWFCDAVVYTSRIRCGWGHEDFSPWNQLLLDKKRGSGTVTMWHGELDEFKLSTVEELKEEFTDQFAKWKKIINVDGLPGLVISMLERKKTFRAEKIEGLYSNDLPPALTQRFVEILDAAVAGSHDKVDDYLGEGVGETILGRVGALALREDVRVDEVERMNVSGGDDANRVMIHLTYKDPRLQEVGTARFEFRSDQENWIMQGFDWQTINR